MSDAILLTGATGHVGRRVLRGLLDDSDARVFAVVRGADDAEVRERTHKLVEQAGLTPEAASRLHALRGDVASPGLGLEARASQAVRAEVTSLVHVAATVRFDLPDDEAQRLNVGGTTHVLAVARGLAEAGRLRRMDHVSTCFVAGRREGRVLETECDVGQTFRNSYERSKCMAERVVRQAMTEGLPVAIHRPSIVVGESGSGRTDAFNVLYWPVKVWVKGLFRIMPGNPATTVDIVPVDFVADAIVRLRRDGRTVGHCHALAVGDEAPTIHQVVTHIRRIARAPSLVYMKPSFYERRVRWLFWPYFQTRVGRAVDRGGQYFLPYLEGMPLFDNSQARRSLGDLQPPPVSEYFERIIRYAVEKDFGAEGAGAGRRRSA